MTINETTYKQLRCTNGNLPRGYGLPKIHKAGYPLRIIISTVGSPVYNIATYLSEILQNAVKKPRSHIKDSWSFVETIKDKNIDDSQVMISLDVTSLFTNTPWELIKIAIENRWEDISQFTTFNLAQFLHAIDTVMCSTSFVFDGKFYEQVFGSPMGSPLSPILSDMVMDDLESYCLRQLDFEPSCYFRYVDDIFSIIPKGKMEDMLMIFNGFHNRLKFTFELENNCSLSFLDTNVIRIDGRLTTNWFRKPTFSGRYINFLSNHPMRYKLSVITSLVDRAILLADPMFHEENINIIRGILRNNCYPLTVINNNINKRLRAIKFGGNCSSLNHNKFDARRCMVLPYIRDLSENITRCINKNGVDVLYTVPKKLDTLIKRGKDRIDNLKRTDVVYKIECANCDSTYIGQTKRHLETRIKEHRNNIKKDTTMHSVVSLHRTCNDHEFRWDSPVILHQEKQTRKREIAEMFYIKRQRKSINLQKDTENFSGIYDRVLDVI